MPYDEIYLNSIMRIMRAASSESLRLRDVHAYRRKSRTAYHDVTAAATSTYAVNPAFALCRICTLRDPAVHILNIPASAAA
ncbi:MAG TPA: hypothetical protein VFB80_20670, partial [Pirellulaceae bacterium]|nr:hypothetical protein [Pirellulaceae bacterium]